MGYLDEAARFYSEAALTPDVGLCCVQSRPLSLPGLVVPEEMLEMNYGCGSTVHPAELSGAPRILYVGVGGGLEALSFAYFSRRPGGVLGVDPVPEMRRAAARNLELATPLNPWFDRSFVELQHGDAFALPVEDASFDVVAQNCLFNIFEPEDLARALAEAARVLVPGGRLLMSDPIATRPIPAHLRQDDRLRAMCLSGALPYADYVQHLIDAGFGQVEVRARRPYRWLDAATYGLEAPLLLESLDSVSFRVAVPEDGACVFTGRTATYLGPDDVFEDAAGHRLPKGLPAAVCDKTARLLGARADVWLTEPTWYYAGGGCC